MEILFLVISLLLTVIIVYALGRMFFSHNKLVEAYKKDEFLCGFHFMVGLFLTLIIFIALMGCNNTFWHLPYYF
jgi:hypothetical protein